MESRCADAVTRVSCSDGSRVCEAPAGACDARLGTCAEVQIEVASDVALVVFEWLSRETAPGRQISSDVAEAYALARLYGSLQSLLVEPFLPEYDQLSRAVLEYGRVLTEPQPDVSWADLMDVYPVVDRPGIYMIDIDLWTVEEGRSDLALQLEVVEDSRGVRVVVTDLHVL